MNQNIKNFIEEGEKEFDKGYYTFRFEFTDLDGKRKFKVCSWNDGMPKEEALKNVRNYIYGFKNAELTDFIDNSYVKQFISKVASQSKEHCDEINCPECNLKAYEKGKEEERKKLEIALKYNVDEETAMRIMNAIEALDKGDELITKLTKTK